jgi:3-hydroxybenzoate 6-monooxygenase
LSVLDALGVGDQVKKDALLIERMLMMDGISGDPICDIPCGEAFQSRFGNPYAVAHRADVHGALLRGCQSAGPLIEMRTDSPVVDFEHREGSVLVALESGERILASALIGADGVRSRIRQRLVNDGEPKPAGALIYRALVPAAKMPKVHQKPFPTLWVGPGAHLIYYPVRDWTEFNVGATVLMPGSDLGEGEAGVEEASNAFADWTEIPSSVIRLSSRYQRFVIRYREPIDNWSEGVVTLLGDAAHPMVQYIAQGAAMALEDAMCIADQISANEGDFAQAFKEYQKIRIVRSARVQISSLMLDRLYHAKGVERLVRNSIFEERTEEGYYERLSWLFTAPSYVSAKALEET